MRTTELFERITDRIVEAIEAGTETFKMPWHRWGEATAQPVNAFSGRPYRGINTLWLWATAELAGHSSGRWATFRQWESAGATVQKGAKGCPILFWKTAANEPRGEEGEDSDEAEGGRARFLARIYNVFNSEQVTGAKSAPPRPILSTAERVAAAEDFIAATGAQIRHGGDRACYVANIDQIWLPRFEQFRDRESYYSVAAHEAVHWTGAKHRLDRDLSCRFGTDAYAIEELVAELGAAFVAAHLGLSIEPRSDHAAYIASWLRVLRGDPRAILTASAKAQEAVDYLITCSSAEAAPNANWPQLPPSISKQMMHPVWKVTEFRQTSTEHRRANLLSGGGG
jgi:antirestriction protein ArdC